MPSFHHQGKTLLKWAEGAKGTTGEDPVVQGFVQGIVGLEEEHDNIERIYNDHFRIFVKLWKGILAGKKELNSATKDYEAVVGKLRAAEKKKEKTFFLHPFVLF